MPSWKKVITSGSDATLNSLTVSNGITGSLFGSASYTLTASYVNNLNQNVLITGSLTVGATSLGANENTLVLGPAPAGGTGEGGQLLLQAQGGTYTSASMWDNYQNLTRLLRGTNASSDAVVASFNMHSKQVQFPAYNNSTAFSGTVAGFLAFDTNGYIITSSGSGAGGGAGSGTINTGTAGYLAYYPSTGTTVDDASGLYWSSGNSQFVVTGSIIATANGAMYFRGGDDTELWDINISNTIGIYGQQDQGIASIKLGSGGGTISGRSGSIGIGTTTPTSGTLQVNGNVYAESFTGSLQGSASYALTASYALNGGGSTDTGSLLVTASVSLNTITFTKGDGSTFPITVNTGSGGGGSGAGFPFTGSAEITGSLIVTGSVTSTIGFTGSLEGTASWAYNALTASYSLRTIQTDVLVLNQAGFNIPKGTVVRITGSNNASDIPRVVTASYEDDNNSANTLGITTQLITNGSEGYVITEGVLTGIDTSNYVSGQLIYLGPTGSITGSAPVAPLHSVRLGEVIREQNNNGSIYVRIDNGYELGELHDVLTTNSTTGDLLVKSGSIWINSKQLTGSYSLTGSLVVKAGSSNIINANSTQGVLLSDLSGNVIIDTDAGTLYDNIQNDTSIDLFNRKLYRSTNIAPPIGGTVSVDWENGIFSGSLHGTSSWSENSTLLGGANRNTFITTGSSGGNQTISGSLTITQNLTVLGSSSITYVTSSQLDISTNIISVNTVDPGVRFGGLAVIDSGSSPQTSGSLLFDSQNNQWIFVHKTDSSAAVTSSVLIMGPQTFDDLGNETTITANRLTKGTGGDLGEHIGDSNITDTGTLVSINSDTEITGSLTVTGQINGNVIIPAAALFNYYNFI